MTKKIQSTRERQAHRRAQLDEIARRAGYDSWSAYETEVINHRVSISGTVEVKNGS